MKEIENDKLMSLVIAVYIGSIINENSEIYLICKDGSNYKKSVELALSEEVNITLYGNIAGKAQEEIKEKTLQDVMEEFGLADDMQTFVFQAIKEAKDTYPDNKDKQLEQIGIYFLERGFINVKFLIAIEPYI